MASYSLFAIKLSSGVKKYRGDMMFFVLESEFKKLKVHMVSSSFK